MNKNVNYQGSVLGPTLLLLYINDIVKVIKKSSCYLYANDMLIVNSLRNAESLSDIQNDLNKLFQRCNKNKLTINISKAKAQYFPKDTNVDTKNFYTNNPITINNSDLVYEHNFRYLGIEIDNYLTMKPTYEAIYKNASHKLYTGS